jgi:hypothetical protein
VDDLPEEWTGWRIISTRQTPDFFLDLKSSRKLICTVPVSGRDRNTPGYSSVDYYTTSLIAGVSFSQPDRHISSPTHPTQSPLGADSPRSLFRTRICTRGSKPPQNGPLGHIQT